MAKLRINGDSSGYVDLEAPNAASSSTLDLDQVPQKNAANTFSTINKFADSVAIGGTHSPSNNLDVRSTGQVIVRVDGSGLYYNGIKIRNNYSSVQSDWNVGAAGGTSGWGSANGTFIIRDDTTNSTGLEIEQGAGSNTAALLIKSSGAVTTPSQPGFRAGYTSGSSVTNNVNNKHPFTNVAINRGNNYSGPNARFTAPVAGLYQFSACFWVNANNNADFAPRLNGSSWIPSAPGSDSIIFVQLADSYIQNLSGTFLLELQANDYVELQSRNYTSNYYGGHSWWEGLLIG